MQKIKFKWKSVKPEDAVIRKPVAFKPGPLQPNASKGTFIDHVITFNTKEKYPRPGPGSAFHDKKSAKIYDEEVRSLVEMKVVSDKKLSSTTKAPRAMTFVNEKYQKSMPGPGKYFAVDKNAKKVPKDKGIKYDEYKKFTKDKIEMDSNKIKAEKERVQEVKDKIKGEVPKFPLPIPADMVTFDKYMIKYGSEKDRTNAKRAKAKGTLF